MRCYQFVGEPRGAVYRSLLSQVCLRHGARFSMVCREKAALADHPSNALRRLCAWCVEERDVNQWPGTLLLGHSARLYIFDVNAESIDVLCHQLDDLHDFLLAQGLEQDDFIDAIEKLRTKVCLYRGVNLRFCCSRDLTLAVDAI